ncbi:hypothetical protein AB8B02_19095 [Tardiphaga sp. 862_B3_N4_1]|uniref:hypothetical protein n=1 Tax=Tardiphaga sp. 862_B3_N4_1 TaxID=3240764 RepID=UPI003F212FAF
MRQIKMLGAAGVKLEIIRRLLPCVTSDNPAFKPCNDLRRGLFERRGATMNSKHADDDPRTPLHAFSAVIRPRWNRNAR